MRLFKSFRAAEEGSLLPLFGMLFVAMVTCTGVAIDAARSYRAYTLVSASLDSAALSAAKFLRLNAPSDSDLGRLARSYFDANMQQGGRNAGVLVESFSITPDRDKNSVSLSVMTALPTTIMNIFGLTAVNIPISSQAVYDAKDVELSMMLDVSGSMEGFKVADLKAAARDLVDILITQAGDGVRNRIAIAPYSTAVNAGELAEQVSGLVRAHDCVTERPGRFAFTDDRVGNAPLGRRTSSCPENSVLPLTNDAARLNARIDELEADGSTAGHLGIAWSWYLISPEWADVYPPASQPKPYGDPETLKAVIIMTDGEFNTSYERGNGNSQNQAQRLCTNMKAAGILVFSVAFQAPPAASDLLRQCASSSSQFFDADDGMALRAAFNEIANKLTGLRLSF